MERILEMLLASELFSDIPEEVLRRDILPQGQVEENR